MNRTIGFPVTGALDADGLARIVEGVRLANSRAEFAIAGVGRGAAGIHRRRAWGYAQLAEEFGVQRIGS